MGDWHNEWIEESKIHFLAQKHDKAIRALMDVLSDRHEVFIAYADKFADYYEKRKYLKAFKVLRKVLIQCSNTPLDDDNNDHTNRFIVESVILNLGELVSWEGVQQDMCKIFIGIGKLNVDFSAIEDLAHNHFADREYKVAIWLYKLLLRYTFSSKKKIIFMYRLIHCYTYTDRLKKSMEYIKYLIINTDVKQHPRLMRELRVSAYCGKDCDEPPI